MFAYTLAGLLLLNPWGVSHTPPAPPDSAFTEIRARLRAAEAVYWQDPFDVSAARLADLAGRARNAGDRESYATAMALLGLLRGRLTGAAAAVATLDSAWAATPSSATATQAFIRCAQAGLGSGGRLTPAAAVREGLALAQTASNPIVLGACYRTSALLLNALLPDPSLPLAQADRAVQVNRAAGDSAQLAISLIAKGYLKFNHFELAAAQTELSNALVAARASHAPDLEAGALRWLSAVAWDAGDYVTAAGEFLRADTLFRAAHDSAAMSELLQGYGVGALARGEADSAERIFQAWRDAAERRGNNGNGYYARVQLAQVELVRGRWPDALDRLQAAAAFGRTHGLPAAVGGLRYFEGIALLRMGRLAEAKARFDSALATSGADEYLDQYAIHSRIAETSLRAGDTAGALLEITRASDRLDSLRSTLSDRDLRPLVFQTRQGYDEADLGFATIIAGLVRGGRAEAALRLAEHRRARSLEDRLLRAQILSTDSAHTTPVGSGTTPGDPAAMDDHTAAIEYLAGPAGQPTTRFVVTRAGIRAEVLPSLDSLASDLERFAGLLQSGAASAVVATRVSTILLGPAVADLPVSVTRLVIVPDGALHRVPFAALPLEDGRPLITRFAVSLAPSLAVAQVLARRRSPGNGPVLALGDPAFGSGQSMATRTEVLREAFDVSGGLPRLEASADEARRAAGYVAGSVLRLGADASEAYLKHTPLTGFRVLHFATHALVDDRTVARTALALSPGDGEDGFVTAGEIAQLSLNADLVVLSACRTADGLVVGGEGVQGLTAPFLQAGARAVLATLWPVTDRSAARFEAEFYRELAGGAPAGEALRRASASAIAGGAPASEWAAFVLVGDPSVVVPLRSQANRWRWGAMLLVVALAYGVWRLKLTKGEATMSPEGRRPRTRQL